MNRHLFLRLLLALFTTGVLSAENIHVEPAFWWSGMKNPEQVTLNTAIGRGFTACKKCY